jgi:hypothetical protein
VHRVDRLIVESIRLVRLHHAADPVLEFLVLLEQIFCTSIRGEEVLRSIVWFMSGLVDRTRRWLLIPF